MIGIYLAAGNDFYENENIIYQDINGKRDIPGDMLEIDITNYDYIIATPPCNYYSRANYRRDISEYSLKTKHLLPGILEKLNNQDKPFIVENVKNYYQFKKANLFDYKCHIYSFGRHVYWTNILMPDHIYNRPDRSIIEYLPTNKRQSDDTVHEVISTFLKLIKDL